MEMFLPITYCHVYCIVILSSGMNLIGMKQPVYLFMKQVCSSCLAKEYQCNLPPTGAITTTEGCLSVTDVSFTDCAVRDDRFSVMCISLLHDLYLSSVCESVNEYMQA